MTSRAYGARSPRSHDIILIATSFATELARPPLRTYTNVRTRTDTLPRLIYKDYFDHLFYYTNSYVKSRRKWVTWHIGYF